MLRSPPSIHPIPHTLLSSTATGHWPEPLQQQRSHKNYADIPDVNMTYFEALQKPADLAVFLQRWPTACVSLHDMLYKHNQRFKLSSFSLYYTTHFQLLQIFCTNVPSFLLHLPWWHVSAVSLHVRPAYTQNCFTCSLVRYSKSNKIFEIDVG